MHARQSHNAKHNKKRNKERQTAQLRSHASLNIEFRLDTERARFAPGVRLYERFYMVHAKCESSCKGNK